MSKVRQTYEDLRRLREIVAVLFDAGFSGYVDAARLQYLVPVRARWRRPFLTKLERERLERPVPVRVREAFESLGPTFVKFGQMLSLRADLAGEDFAREFQKLQQGARTIPFEEVEKTIQTALGKPVARAFVTFEKKPLAAASLAQVHRATLSGRRKVAVKIQRSGIREKIEHDLHLMLILAHILERSAPSLARYRPVAVVKEFADWTMRELDFTVEAANIDRFRANFADRPDLKIPEVIWSHTRREVLVMELIEGETFDKLPRTKVGRELRLCVAKNFTRSLLKMYFGDGFFQADPHPGNFRVLPDGTLAMFDFGMVGYLPADLRAELVSCFISYVNRDSEAYARHLLELAEPGPEANVSSFKREAQGILDRLMFRPTNQKGGVYAFAKIVNLGASYDLHFPSDLVLLARSLATGEATAIRLASDFDIDALIKPFLDELMKSQLDPRNYAKSFRSNFFDYLGFLKEMPERTIALLKKAESGEFGVKLNFGELRDLKDEFDRENDIRIVSLTAAALFVGSAVMMLLKDSPALYGLPVGQIALLTSLVLFVWTALQVMHRPR